ncbi:MAG: YihY/virulence factor BrkB family protein [Myxococcales bacterium]|nr:YihY/virulence factor BrkB family protein [Myxococcales bacterium]
MSQPEPPANPTAPASPEGVAQSPPVGRLSPPLDPSARWVMRLGRTVRRLAEGLYYHDGLSAAPAMAFHFFLSLLPLVVVAGWLLGRFARTRGVEAFFAPVFTSAPTAVVTISRGELERLAAADLKLAPLALGGFFWLASSGVHGMMDAFERALSVPTRRPYWKKRLLSLCFVAGGLVAVCAVSFLAVGWEAIATAAHDVPAVTGGLHIPPSAVRLRAHVDKALGLGAFFAFAVCGVAIFYRLAVAYPIGVRRRIWPGAVLAIVLWLVISWAFGLYVGSLGQYTLYYGSLAAVAVLLVWFWLTSLALLIGAELNAQLEGARR